MKLGKRILSAVLVLVLCFSLTAMAFADETERNSAYKQYTNVFVHGLFGWGSYDDISSVLQYWGATSGNVMSYLASEGYDVHAASVGPISSCWDRCCELYAQLTGTVTDYGAAHVVKSNADFASAGSSITHERFGRDYSDMPLIAGWGPIYDDNGKVIGWYDNKINLIGHSFGGPTITMFTQLLEYGDEAEREAAKAEAAVKGGDWYDYCSPLFWGNHNAEKLINSLTSLAGVLNGTTFIDSCDDSTEIICSLAMGLANVIGPTVFNDLYDFQLDQFGITKSGNPDYCNYTLDLLRAVKFLDAKDNAIYDLSIGGCNELKQGWKCFDHIFYFAYPGCATSESIFGTQIPNIDIWDLFIPFSTFMGAYTNPNEIVLDIYGNPYTSITKEWLPNDGMVNTITASYVFGCGQKPYDGKVEPGMWITMPTYGYDHMDYIGGLADVTQNSWQTKAFFDDVMKNINATYSYEEKLDAPELSVSNVNYSSSVDLEWNSVDGATAYKIYRASSKNGSYSLLKTTSGTSWRDYSPILGRTYYYKVVAVNDNVSSEYSNVASLFVTYSKYSTYVANKIKGLFS